MIKPTELRRYNFISPTTLRKGRKIPSDIIGKIVSLEHFCLEWIRVEEIPACVVRWNRCEYHEIEPISLTEEWLLKFGFVEIDDDGLWGHPSEELFQLQSKYLEGEGKFNHIWDASYTEAPIEFVHHLQNLYFALTGEELTIKETV